MVICVGTVDALQTSPDFSLQEPPHGRFSGSTPNPVFTETPSHRHDGSADSHRKVNRKMVV